MGYLGGVSGVAICGFGEDDLLPGYKEIFRSWMVAIGICSDIAKVYREWRDQGQ